MEKKRNFTVERLLELSAKRGNVYKYPLRIEDIPKMPRFTDSAFRYHVISNAYKVWRADPKNKEFTFKFFIRDFEKIWRAISDEMFLEMEENFQGVHLPFQLGDMYIGIPPEKDYFILINKPNYKYIVWRTKNKYISKDLRYYYFHSFHKRYRSAAARDDYYKTAREKIHRFKIPR